MGSIRGASWFFVLAMVLACWIGVLGSLRGVAEAGVIASHGGGGDFRAEDLAKMQAFLEGKVVLQKLVDYGVSPEEAMAKIRSMDERDLHRLASLTDRVAAGADGVGLAIGLAVLVILILVILMLMNKRVVVR
ncbi:MAG: PA2779 family protein [Deltaproteobacteria bacterium]|nr:PA2779 family protein [Candidatus Deferrimicrobiaceae bacterium]